MHTCPNCGFCPHCGRSDQPTPIRPMPGIQPETNMRGRGSSTTTPDWLKGSVTYC